MGLLDEVLKTMQAGGVPNDPRARPAPVPAPTPGAPASHGMSPMAKALLALLAAYAAKNLSKAPSETPTSPSGRSGGTVTADNMPGGGRLDDLLGGLSQALPRFVDELTPDGRLMSDAEAEHTL